MDQELQDRLTRFEQKLDETWQIARSAKRLFVWSIIISLALVIIPLIGLAIALPSFLRTLNVDSIIGSY